MTRQIRIAEEIEQIQMPGHMLAQDFGCLSGMPTTCLGKRPKKIKAKKKIASW
jgi:hypothetical protein